MATVSEYEKELERLNAQIERLLVEVRRRKDEMVAAVAEHLRSDEAKSELYDEIAALKLEVATLRSQLGGAA